MRAEVVALDLCSPVPDAGGGSVARLADALAGFGLELAALTHIRAHERDLEDILGQSLRRSHLVIITGGVVRGFSYSSSRGGEDLVKKTLSRLLDRRLILQPELLKRLENAYNTRRVTVPSGFEKSALLPQGSVGVPDSTGEPFGFYLEHGGRYIMFVPALSEDVGAALPVELAGLLTRKSRAWMVESSRVVRTFGLEEYKVAEIIKDVNGKDISLTLFGSPEGVDIRVSAKAELKDKADAALDDACTKLMGILDDYCYATGSTKMEETVARLLTGKKLTISTAESCTGGLIAKRLTDVSGSSVYMERGVVTYSNRAKVDLLGVPERTLEEHGAVSRETAQEMAQGMRWNSGTDLALSVTGVAGPTGGTPAKPVGLVYIGFATQDGVTVRGFNFPGDREEVRFQTSQRALDIVRRYLLS